MIQVRLLGKKDEREAFSIWKDEMILQWESLKNYRGHLS